MKSLDLNFLLSYNPENGCLTWKNNYFPAKIGKEAGALRKDGYRMVGINKKVYYAHRLIFYMVTETCPKYIDHINGNTSDNRWSNLRAADSSINAKNCKLHSSNITGQMGVHKTKNFKKWWARIESNGKIVHLGTFDTYDEAVKARKQAESDYNFNFNHGRI